MKRVVSFPARPLKESRRLRRTGTSLLIAAVVLLLIGANLLIFRNLLPQIQPPPVAHKTPTVPVAYTPAAPTVVENGWQHLWTLPALPPLDPSLTYDGFNSPHIPQFAWSPANAQRLYLCRAVINYNLPTILHDLYRSDDTGAHWSAYPLPEVASNCRLQVDPTNANALVLQDTQVDKYHSFVSTDGAQHWRAIPNPPDWGNDSNPPPIQIVAGRLYVGQYWTTDLVHWTLWYPFAKRINDYVPLNPYPLVNPQHLNTLYTAVLTSQFQCSGTPHFGFYVVTLCRSDDGGRTWRFLHKVYISRGSLFPSVCLAYSKPDLLYAAVGDIVGLGDGWLSSVDGGNSWTALPLPLAVSQNNLICNTGVNLNVNMAGTNTVPSAVTIDTWQNKDNPNYTYYSFGLAPDGTLYHAGLYTVKDQGTVLPAGISIFRHNRWEQIVSSFPVPVSITNAFLRITLITPSAGSPFLLAYNEKDVYIYHLNKGD